MNLISKMSYYLVCTTIAIKYNFQVNSDNKLCDIRTLISMPCVISTDLGSCEHTNKYLLLFYKTRSLLVGIKDNPHQFSELSWEVRKQIKKC